LVVNDNHLWTNNSWRNKNAGWTTENRKVLETYSIGCGSGEDKGIIQVLFLLVIRSLEKKLTRLVG
jgi:hypothetical protein